MKRVVVCGLLVWWHNVQARTEGHYASVGSHMWFLISPSEIWSLFQTAGDLLSQANTDVQCGYIAFLQCMEISVKGQNVHIASRKEQNPLSIHFFFVWKNFKNLFTWAGLANETRSWLPLSFLKSLVPYDFIFTSSASEILWNNKGQDYQSIQGDGNWHEKIFLFSCMRPSCSLQKSFRLL